MKTKTVTVLNKSGLHARWAAELVKMTNRFQAMIEISKDENRVDGKSIMGILTLAAGHLTELTFVVQGDDEEEAVRAIDDFFHSLSKEESANNW